MFIDNKATVKVLVFFVLIFINCSTVKAEVNIVCNNQLMKISGEKIEYIEIAFLEYNKSKKVEDIFPQEFYIFELEYKEKNVVVHIQFDNKYLLKKKLNLFKGGGGRVIISMESKEIENIILFK